MSRCHRKSLNLQVKKEFQRWLLFRVFAAVLVSAGVAALILYFYANQEVGESFYSAHITIRRVSDLLLPVVLAGTGVSLLAGMILALFLPQRIAGPIYRIEEDLRRVGEGDLTVKVVLRKGDILFDFADNINGTIADLQKRVSSIQHGLAEYDGKGDTEQHALEQLRNLKT